MNRAMLGNSGKSARHYKNEFESGIVSICICPGLSHWIKVVAVLGVSIKD